MKTVYQGRNGIQCYRFYVYCVVLVTYYTKTRFLLSIAKESQMSKKNLKIHFFLQGWMSAVQH